MGETFPLATTTKTIGAMTPMKNPVFKNTPTTGYSPSPGGYMGGAMTHASNPMAAVMNKALIQFGVLLAAAAATGLLMPPDLLSPAVIASGLLAMGMAFAMAFMRRVPVPLLFLYAVVEGVFVGAATLAYSYLYDGVVPTAILSTSITALVIVMGVRANVLRTTSRMRQIFGYALMGYFAFSLVAFIAAATGHGFLTLGTPLCLAVSIFGVFMAAFSLTTDVEDVRRLSAGADDNMQWRLGFGLVVSVVWLYLEMLRLVANITSMRN